MSRHYLDKEYVKKLYNKGLPIDVIAKRLGRDKKNIKCIVDPEYHEYVLRSRKKRRVSRSSKVERTTDNRVI